MIIGFDIAKQMIVVGCNNQGFCPPLTFFPSFAAAVKKTKPKQIVSVFFEPPLSAGKITVQISG